MQLLVVVVVVVVVVDEGAARGDSSIIRIFPIMSQGLARTLVVVNTCQDLRHVLLCC